MKKSDRDLLLTIGGAALLWWLFKKKHGKCPNCNFPVTDKDHVCPNCWQLLNWEDFK